MGGDNLIMKKAKVGIHDQSRGMFLNRGVFIKAPPSFFASYPSDFEPLPPQAAKQLNLKVRTITEWDPKTGLSATPKMQAPVAVTESVAATEAAQPTSTVLEDQPEQKELPAVSEAAAAVVAAQPTSEAAPVVEKAPKAMSKSKTNKRAMKIR